ncbi:MAG TPA: hypothetical protein VFQ47_01320 [Nitrososphaera sp.]|jgi:hypothetical protein|nr:hypothetical protein [Nitrososphaera sp.]
MKDTKHKSSLKERFEYRMAIIIGIGQAFIGLMLTVIPPLTVSPLWIIDLLSHVGIGILAAGVLTATLEPISRMRLQRAIEEIRTAHFEAILKGFMPEPIFEEVQNHIIREPFLRSNFRVAVEFSWKDEAREYLSKSQTVRYDVQNIAQNVEEFEVNTWEERKNEDKFPNNAAIYYISVQTLDGSTRIEYNENNIHEIQKVTDQLVEAQFTIHLKPGQKAEVIIRMRSVLLSKDIYPFVMSNATVGLDFTVAHPNNLIVEAIPMHPSKSAFRTEVLERTVKRWRIEKGLLPFQGVQVSWQPDTHQPEHIAETNISAEQNLQAEGIS